MLRTYHEGDALHVFDACQGSGVLWSHLRREFVVASYWGVDQKAKAGRLKIDSVRLLEAGLIGQNVIDVDTYGAPWKHWEALLPFVQRPTTVFLTIGRAISGTSLGMQREMVKWLGLDSFAYVPPVL